MNIKKKIGISVGILIVFAILVWALWASTPVINTEGFFPYVNRNIIMGDKISLQYTDAHLYKNGVSSLIKLSKQRIALDATEHTDSYASIFEPMENAYVTEQYIIYWVSQNYQCDLYCKKRETDTIEMISKDTEKYIQLHGENVYYCKNSESHQLNSNELWRYNMNTGENSLILNNIASFFINEETLYSISCETEFNNITVKEHLNILCSYDLESMDLLTTKEIPLSFVATCMRVNSDRTILWSSSYCWLYVYDLSTQTGEYLICPPDALSSRAVIKLNYNDQYIFLSITVSKRMSTRDLGATEHQAGTWRYDLISKEWLQISPHTYEALYVFDETSVFGIIGKKVYQIASDGSQTIPIR